jgi:hypothetical protein
MKKWALVLMLINFAVAGHAQKISIFGGGNFSVFSSYTHDDFYKPAGTDFQLGYNVGLDVTETFLGLITIRYQKTGGHFYFQNIHEYLKSDLTVKTIGLGLYPVNLDINKIFFIQLGGEVSYKISAAMSNEEEYRSFFNYSSFFNNVSIQNNWNFGLGVMFSHHIQITDEFTLIPRTRLYIGLTDEFKNEIAKTALRTMSYEIVVKYEY